MPTHRWRRSRTPSILVDLNLTLGAGTMSHLARVQTRPTRVKTCRAPRYYPRRARRSARRGAVPGATSPAASWYSRRRLDSRRSRRRVPSSLVSERPPPPPPPPRTPGAPGTLPPPSTPTHRSSPSTSRASSSTRATPGASAVDATLDSGITTRSLSPRRRRPPRPSPDDASPLVTWDDIANVADDEKGAYVLTPGAPAERFQAFSEGHLPRGEPHALRRRDSPHRAHRRIQHASLRRRRGPHGGHRAQNRRRASHPTRRARPRHLHGSRAHQRAARTPRGAESPPSNSTPR